INIHVFLKGTDSRVYFWPESEKGSINLDSLEFEKIEQRGRSHCLLMKSNLIIDPKILYSIYQRIKSEKSYKLRSSVYSVCPLLVNFFFGQLDLHFFEYNKGKFDKYESEDSICIYQASDS